MAFTEANAPAEVDTAGLDAVARRGGISLSVVIATHNRPDLLTSCLEALAPQAARPDVEVIIVDSCSSPEVAEHVRALAAKWRFLHLRLEQPGVSKARNEGAALASADWFATLDDDAIPKQGWVEGALAAIQAAPPDAALIQGRVEPLWVDMEPARVEPRHARFLSIVMYDTDHEMSLPPHCAGANMLVRRDMHARIGGYGEKFGRVRSELVSGIDTDLAERLGVEGGRVYYSNRFAVRHFVPAVRMTAGWLRERSLKEGQAQGQIMFSRRPPMYQVVLFGKLIAAFCALTLLSLVNRRSLDLLIRRHVNLGMLQRAPAIRIVRSSPSDARKS